MTTLDDTYHTVLPIIYTIYIHNSKELKQYVYASSFELMNRRISNKTVNNIYQEVTAYVLAQY